MYVYLSPFGAGFCASIGGNLFLRSSPVCSSSRTVWLNRAFALSLCDFLERRERTITFASKPGSLCFLWFLIPGRSILAGLCLFSLLVSCLLFDAGFRPVSLLAGGSNPWVGFNSCRVAILSVYERFFLFVIVVTCNFRLFFYGLLRAKASF